MPHWAELDENDTVLRVIVCDADDGADGTLRLPKFLTSTEPGNLPWTEGYIGTWQRTYYSTPGHTFAGIGFVWNGSDFEGPPALPTPDEGAPA